MKIKYLPLFILSLIAAFSNLSGKTLVNKDSFSNLALEGYDAVSFFTEDKAVKGKDSISANYLGATYHFASTENRRLFERNPAKYAPAFGGFCACTIAEGMGLKQGKVATWQIVDGRLILTHDEKAKKRLNADIASMLVQADQAWPTLVAEKGSES